MDDLRDISAFALASKHIEIQFLLAHLGKAGLLTQQQVAEYCNDVSDALEQMTIRPGAKEVRAKAVEDYRQTAEQLANWLE